ncbi:23S rRNA (uracil(1939)-C(5))-methyltransferase RlmD [Hungatella hathewayi]|uniref:23S rRNA (Uracil(1939)-C(5))-methyltransferase RlmD n=1 Tax=Hungatella hathewayi TaxID=154046 RepID=A0A3E3DC31_9FIRM|nr:23S rRNA (uracil(1939)-C(5))-methyltransferase RlmD [Hungatella hathewayi]RGD66805.1 23S rRNA (uracil(1939)-C(5))-methyltransferase RlmD [Hungatella hathewayi]
MEWKKNDRIQVTIEDMGDTGEGIGKTDGYTWFVKDAVIGDEVEAKVMKTKKSYGFARLEKIINASPNRVTPRCPVARQCGGCQLQAMDYNEQLAYKERKIYNNITRIGGFDEVPMLPIMGMDEPWRYRNKAQFPWGLDKDGKIITGFYAGRTHAIIENGDCLLGIEENREILKIIKNHLERCHIRPYDEASHSGLIRHTLIRKGFHTGELMVCQVINGKSLPHQDELTEQLLKIPGMTSISVNINRDQTNVILGNEVINLYGPGYITDSIGGVKYRISPLSFYQVNPVQTEKLYSTALEYAGLTGGETVWDLYCGIGTISLFLAQKAKKVYGVEIVPQAIDDARENARINGIENVEFFVGKAEEVLPREYEKNQVYADVIVVDPPRKGCDEVCLDTIVKMGPKRVVYVSCDSATLARDMKYLAERGYEVVKVRGCDMFPHSGHVETVVLLSHKKADSYIHIDVEFGEGEGKIPVDSIAKRAEAYKPKEKVTYKMIKEYIEAKYGFKVHTAYIAEVKRNLGLPMYDAPNAVEELKQPRKHPTPEKVEAIKDALRYFAVI